MKNAYKASIIACLVGLLGGVFSSPAFADDWHRDDRRRIEEERRAEERRRMEELRRRPHPVVYAPAPVVVMPPPPSPGISIVLPIEIR
jgi:hypothetical protein